MVKERRLKKETGDGDVMKIVILDGNTINPGDLTWEAVEVFGECMVYSRSDADEVFERSKEADIIITSKMVFDRELILRLPRLKYIGVIATGYNNIDLGTAAEKNITVTNIPDYCTDSVAQMAFAHVLELCRQVGHHDRSVKEGRWATSPDFCFWDYPQVELCGKTLGLIGCGSIGTAVAKIALAFGMKVTAYDVAPRGTGGLPIEFLDLETVLSESDVISLHCPLTPDTKEIINASTLARMKNTAFLINTGRGPLVNEDDLAAALNEGAIAGAGLDVLDSEPPPDDTPLLTARNCFITPHIAWSSREARIRLIQITADNIRAFLDGNPVNTVI